MVGSSRMRSRGLASSAIAMPSRCFIPRLKRPARLDPVSVRSTVSSTSSMRPSGMPSNVVRTSRFSRAVRLG